MKINAKTKFLMEIAKNRKYDKMIRIRAIDEIAKNLDISTRKITDWMVSGIDPFLSDEKKESKRTPVRPPRTRKKKIDKKLIIIIIGLLIIVWLVGFSIIVMIPNKTSSTTTQINNPPIEQPSDDL